MWTITFIDALFPMIPYAMDQNSFNMVSVGKKRVKNCLKSIKDLLVKIHLILTTIKINARRTFESAFEKHWLPINILFIMNLLKNFSGLIKNVWLLITLVLLHNISWIKEEGSAPSLALSQKILENYYVSNINIPNHQPEQKIWISWLTF